MEVLLWIGAAQSLFSAIIFLLLKKNKSLANKILTAWLFIISFEFITTGIDFSTGFHHLTNPFLVFNPLLYFYSKALINPSYKLKWHQIWQLLPYFFVKISAYVEGVAFMPEEFFTIDNTTWLKIILSLMSIASFIGYSIPSLINIHRFRINLKNEFSTINKRITLGWLLIVIVFYMTFISIAYILGVINIVTRIATHSQLVSFAFLLVLVYIFSFYGLLQAQIYPDTSSGKEDKYKHPRLTPEKGKEYKEMLDAYFIREKPFLNSELTITDLSVQLNVSRHMLTEVLNTEIGLNFYQFVNTFRVNEAKRLLTDSRYGHYSMDAIGFECGFNSKSSFYAVFKKTTGMTPARYQSTHGQ